ncbi:MAG TPA: phospho-sugar mutase [Gemmatales bacterium]|mgnify:CR=1 FL=1|nr:phospho-sugar mutase [Gemmatales bacterium]
MDLLTACRQGFAGIDVDAEVKETAISYIRQWLSGEAFASYRPQIEWLVEQQQWAGLLDRFYQILPFGTGGRRGPVGIGPNRMNAWTLTASVQGHCDYLKAKYPEAAQIQVAVAYDVRCFKDARQQYCATRPNPVLNLSSKDLCHLAARVYAANGIYCWVLPPESTRYLATPELSYFIRKLQGQGGLNISASHNPPDDNGGKFYDEFGAQPVPPDDQIMADLVEQVTDIHMLEWNDAVKRGFIRFMDESLHRSYIDLVCKQSMVNAPAPGECKVVFTPLHGVGGMTVQEALVQHGFTVVPVESQSQPDGQFPHVKSPNPEVPASMDEARKLAEEQQADLVLSSDPDADRIGAVVPQVGTWRFLTGNEIAALLTHFRLEQLQVQGRLSTSPVVITTTVTTGQIGRIARKFGVQLVDDLLVGFKYHADVLNQLELHGRYVDITGRPQDLVIGTEESHGAMVTPEIRDKDSGGPSLLLAELVLLQKRRGRTVVDYLDYLNRTYGYFWNGQQTIVMTGILGKQQMLAMLASLRKNPPEEVAGRKVTHVVDYWNEESRFGPIKGQTDRSSRNLLIFHLEGQTKVALRPSGTEPKAKVYIEASTDPMTPGTSAEDWQKLCAETASRGEALGKAFAALAMERVK